VWGNLGKGATGPLVAKKDERHVVPNERLTGLLVAGLVSQDELGFCFSV